MTQKTINIAIVGQPNVGKSSLLNALIGEKLSIVTHKVQTTRFNIKGFLTEGDCQLVFIDTPGLFEPERKLEKAIVENAKKSFDECDLVCAVYEPYRVNDYLIELLNVARDSKKDVIAVINKIDTIEKPKLLPLAEKLQDLAVFKDIFFVSALKKKGLEKLKDYFIKQAKAGTWLYEADAFTDLPARKIAEEITREQFYILLHKELPYSMKVETESWKDGEDGITEIHQVIYLLKESQKTIALGTGGEKIKEIGTRARKKIGHVLGIKLRLFLHIKVRKDWIDKTTSI